jgi:hypothetical protein
VQRDYNADDSTFDYVIFQEQGLIKAKNQTSGSVDFSSATASLVISQALATGNSVFIKAGNYPLSADVFVFNKRNARIVGAGANVQGNGYKIVMKGDNYTLSQNNIISGLTITNATLRIENSFAVTVSDLTFQNCSTALELVNTETWTEGTVIENCRFISSGQAIAFRTPSANGTGSYASTEIKHSFFNLADDSVGINVEPLAEFSDSQLDNVRMWLGENGVTNQTGLRVDGSMFQTTLSNVVFESFASAPVNFYAISVGATANPTPILGGGISFLGNWTARVYNPSSRWISGQGSLFRRINVDIQLGLNNSYGEATNLHARPLTITSFKPRIQIQGSFGNGETVTVRFRLEFVDNVVSESVEKTFTNTTTSWLSDDDLLKLFPSQDVVWAILIDAKSSSAASSAIVKVDFYGVTT